mgnify:CR=1 FL=1
MIFRIIPTLLCDSDDLVKTQRFKDSKYVGDPINAVKIFNEKEVDELIFVDISASKRKKDPNFNLINEIASECFMPLSYGGGINNLNQMEKILSCGVEKIIINNSLNNTNLIKEAEKIFGSQFLVASIDIKKNIFGKYCIYDYLNKKIISKNIKQYVSFISSLGFGEIYINNIDRDGMRNGYDIDLISSIVNNTSLPVIACGGLKDFNDLKSAYDVGCSGASGGSYFIFQGKHRAVLISYADKDRIESYIQIKNG